MPRCFSFAVATDGAVPSDKTGFGVGFLLVAVCGLLGNPMSASAQVYVEASNKQFGLLNPTSGAYTPIGTTSVLLGGLGFGADGKLYGLAEDNSGSLYTVNTADAAITLVGQTGLQTLGSTGYGFGAMSDGSLVAYLNNTTYSVNAQTAAVTSLGSLGVATNGGLQGDGSGHLYLTQGDVGRGFYQVSPTTGQAALVGTYSGGTVYGMAYANSLLYEIDTTGNISSVDTSTGGFSPVSMYDLATVGLVYTAAALLPVPVPEPASVLGLSAAGLAAAGWVRRRRAAP